MSVRKGEELFATLGSGGGGSPGVEIEWLAYKALLDAGQLDPNVVYYVKNDPSDSGGGGGGGGDSIAIKNNSTFVQNATTLNFLNSKVATVTSNEVSITPTMGGTIAQSFARTTSAPLDPSSIFTSLDGAQSYAATGTTSYVGQVLSVQDGTEYNVYVITPEKTLQKLGGSSGGSTIDVLNVQSFPIGYVAWIPPEEELPAGWLWCNGMTFSIDQNPALYALLGKNTTPVIEDSGVNVAIILGHYTSSVNIPDNGFVDTSGLNQALEKNLVVASNGMIAQMKFEDTERKTLSSTIGYPALQSDDLTTLNSRVQFNKNALAEALINKGITSNNKSTLNVLVNQVNDINVAGGLILRYFTTTSPLVFEQYANNPITSITFDWAYADDSVVNRQSLNGPGAIAINSTARTATLAPNVKDNDFQWTVHGYTLDDIEVYKSINVVYEPPIYYGAMDNPIATETAIKNGTKQLVAEGSLYIPYKDVMGYMFLAVPAAWSQFLSVIEPNGFDMLLNSLNKQTVPVTMIDGTVVNYTVYIAKNKNALAGYPLHYNQ